MKVNIFIRNIATLIFILSSFFSSLQWAEAKDIDFSHQYTSIRSKVIKLKVSCHTFDTPVAAVQLQRKILKQYSTAADWNPENKEWKRLQEVLYSDFDTRKYMEANLALLNLSKNLLDKELDEVIPVSIAKRLTPDELEQLVKYYSQPVGRLFIDTQQKLFQALNTGMNTVLFMMLNQESPVKKEIPSKELEQTLSLFDEYVKIEWALFKPGHEEHGYRTAPLWIASATVANYGEISALWNEISENDRASILAWRESALAVKERDAIAQTTKETRSNVCSPDKNKERATRVAAQLEQKWLKLIDAAK